MFVFTLGAFVHPLLHGYDEKSGLKGFAVCKNHGHGHRSCILGKVTDHQMLAAGLKTT